MSTRVVERVDDWDEQPFSGGYRELQELSDAGFSGVVRAGGAELYLTSGTAVGVKHGSIEDFEEASGTRFGAPTDALPLLAVMQDRSDEVRAKYYTEETSISEVDGTLESGGFTGYVELSENVLSGDYYLVYHQGHSMSVAYVGSADQLITDDEAFEKANGEVGIYEVRPVDIEPIEIPEPPEPEPEPEPDDEAPPEPSPPGGDSPDKSSGSEPDPASPDKGESTESDPLGDTGDEQSADPLDGPATAESTPDEEPTVSPAMDADTTADQEEADSEPSSGQSQTTEREEDGTEAESAGTETSESRSENGTDAESDPATLSEEYDESGTTAATTRTQTEPRQREPTPETAQQRESEAGRQRQWERGEADTEIETAAAGDATQLETRSVPSLDPQRTEMESRAMEHTRRDAPGRATEGGATAAQAETEPAEPAEQSQAEDDPASENTTTQTASAESQQADPETETAVESVEEPEDEQTEQDEATERSEELQDLLDERESEITRLESDLNTAESERESLRLELDQVREERDELKEERDELEDQLRQLEEELGAATNAQQRMTPQEALSGTDLFVRYESKGKATLQKARGGGLGKENVTDNLQLETHTQFDSEVAAVGGREYEEFLEGTTTFKFVRWVVFDLLFEIQSTGHTDTLSDVYDALPKINRIELNGTVNATHTEDGGETQSAESFDVVFRERMGDPLLVANINESRQGATEGMMEQLITSAERVGQTSDQFSSAFLVTESFFEPEALETVAEATRGGILSRDKRKSFVNLSRKRGYHLCLVEARNENFHLEVPEL